jgi:hypothetical protein
MSDNNLYEQLKASFPQEAYSKDNSRGFELTSLKAAYVTERLNDVFGICGVGWRYAYSPFEGETLGGRDEVMTEIALQYKVDGEGVGPVVWDNEFRMWRFPETGTWSTPVFAVGGNGVGKGMVPVTDARKSAVTNGIGKAASMIGVGYEVFRGEIRSGQPQQQQRQSAPAQQARERAKTPVTDNGKVKRPMNPTQVESALRIKAAATEKGGNPATVNQAKFVSRLWQEVWADDDEAERKYHASLQYLFKCESAKGLTFGEASSVITWLREEPESKENYDLHPSAIQEANLVLDKAIAQGLYEQDPEEIPI